MSYSCERLGFQGLIVYSFIHLILFNFSVASSLHLASYFFRLFITLTLSQSWWQVPSI